MNRLSNKVALITGAGAGIGRATALLFAAEGASVALADRNEQTVREAAEEVMAAGGRGLAIHADVSRSDDVQRMLQEAMSRFGRLDILFNNAGIVVQGRAEETREADWDAQISTTLTSVFLGCKYGVPLLRSQGGGVIINMASVCGVMGVVNRAAYSAAKGGVVGLTRAVALDHAEEGVRCVYLAPATIETPSLRERIAAAPDPVAARKAFEARQPVGRIGSVDDVANAALYLASDEAAFVTGCGLAVDGGMAV